MAVSSVHIELDKFFHETRGLNKDNCWEWFESFRNTLLYKGYEENPHPYAMYLLDEMECYSAYCAVGNIEGRVVAELERKKEEVTYEAVYNICVEKKGEEYLNLKEKESRYIEAHPEANKWKSNGRRSAKSSSTKPKEGSKKDAENPEPQATDEAPARQPEPKKPAAVKHALDGDRGFVTVTEDEEAYLVAKYGKDLDEMVSILSNYKESTGKKYKSDAAALRGWVHDSLLEKKAKAERNQPQKSFAQQERERMAASARSLLTDDQIKFYGL